MSAYLPDEHNEQVMNGIIESFKTPWGALTLVDCIHNNVFPFKFLSKMLRDVDKHGLKISSIIDTLFNLDKYVELYNVNDALHAKISIVTKLLRFKLIRKAITHKDNLDNYMCDGIFSPFFRTPCKMNDIMFITKAYTPLITDEDNKEKIIHLLWDIISKFKGDITPNRTKFGLFIVLLTMEMAGQYNIEKIKEDKPNELIKSYDINQPSPLPVKAYITLLYSFSVIYIRLMLVSEQMDLVTNLLTLLSEPGVSMEANECSLINNVVKHNDTVQLMYSSYSNLYEYISFADLHIDIIEFVMQSTRLKMMIQKGMCCVVYDIMINKPGDVSEHVRYMAADLVVDLISTEGYGIFDNILHNFIIYLNEVDCFKQADFMTAVFHNSHIQHQITMLLDYGGSIPDEHVNKFLFSIVKNTAQIQTHVEAYSKLPYNVAHESILFTLINVAKLYSIYKHTHIKSDTHISVADFLFQNININNRFTMNDVLRMTYSIMEENIDCEMMKHMYEIKDVILSKMNNTDITAYPQLYKFLNTTTTTVNYPEEFLDPITLCVVQDPVMVHGSNTIHDRTSIVTQLGYEEKNPYTREQLTIESLNEYNEQEHIKNIINDFVTRKKIWEVEYLGA